MDYRIWAALVKVATLDELEKYENGLYDKHLIAKVVATIELEQTVGNHNNDAQYVKPKKGR